MERRQIVARPRSQRSRITNGAQIALGVNGTTAEARRYRDLLDALSAELGDALTEVETLQIRNCAALQFHAEELTGRMIRGEAVDPEAITRAANGATRALAALKRRKAARKPTSPRLEALLTAERPR